MRIPFVEDLKELDVFVVMQRQVLVMQKAQRTVDVPLVQYIEATVDVQLRSDAKKQSSRRHRKRWRFFRVSYSHLAVHVPVEIPQERVQQHCVV